MKKAFLKAMVLGCVLTATGAFAQDKTVEKPQRNGQKLFEKLDTNADGKLSKEEAEKAEKHVLKEKFDEIDANKDTFVDKEELKAYREKQMTERKKKINE